MQPRAILFYHFSKQLHMNYLSKQVMMHLAVWTVSPPALSRFRSSHFASGLTERISKNSSSRTSSQSLRATLSTEGQLLSKCLQQYLALKVNVISFKTNYIAVYRVILLVVHLCWMDLGLKSTTDCPLLILTARIW